MLDTRPRRASADLLDYASYNKNLGGEVTRQKIKKNLCERQVEFLPAKEKKRKRCADW